MYRVLAYKIKRSGKQSGRIYARKKIVEFETLSEARDFCDDKPLLYIEYSAKAIREDAA